MEEDLIGSFKSFARRRITRCDRCGRPILRSSAKITSDGLAEDTLSEYEELCEQCSLPDAENRRGDE
ncbi:MAG: hypothetical protein M1358_03395 [Chloroflexi bacterium]|nr:hypothetical protein [Chloroflexota bacterium]